MVQVNTVFELIMGFIIARFSAAPCITEHRADKRICGPNRDEVTGGWRKLHNKELRKLPFNKYYYDDQEE
jgi:hypothetical protein